MSPIPFALRLLAVLALSVAFAPATAQAAIDVSTTLTFPDAVTVGQDGLRADVLVANTSTAGESLTLCRFGEAAPCPAGGEGITVLPSCASAAGAVCGAQDPDVFYLHGRGVGVSGACAGMPFIVSELASGRFRLDPPVDGPLVLPAGGSCGIALAVYVLKVPDFDADGASGVQTIALGEATGRTGAGFVTGRGGEIVTVAAAPPPAAAPPAPLLTESLPASPSSDNAPEIVGSVQAAAGTTVTLYTNAACTSAIAAQGTAATFEASGLTVTVASNTTTSFYATATDADGTSPCSTTSITYVEDSTPPPVPTVLGTTPASPSTNTAPYVYGNAAVGTTVAIFGNAACSGDALASGPEPQFAAPGIQTSVGENTTTAFYAAAYDDAGNRSCSTTFALYTVDAAAPAPPTFAGTDPDSPANEHLPLIRGSAEAGSFVRLYANPACAGFPAAQGSAATFAAAGLEATVLNDVSTTLYGTATDVFGHVSACSTASITYVEDSTAPQTTIDGGPSGTIPPAATVRFEFSSSEPGSRFECHLHEPGFQPCTSPATFPQLDAGSIELSARLQVRAIDRADNEDGTPAFRDYVVDEGPAPPPPPGPRIGCTLRVTPIAGTAAANTINGTTRADVILGGAGNDMLRGLAGNDCLYGEAGNDRLRGGSGADRLLGGAGADRVEGESGNDRLTGEAGNDRLTDRTGTDTFSGGAGNDRIDARDTSPTGRRGRDNVRCGSGTRDVVLADRRDIVQRDCERITKR